MSTTPRKYENADGYHCSLLRLIKMEPEWAENQIRHRDQLETELAAVTSERDALKADLCAFAVDMEKQLSASQQREAGRAENDALLTALRALACAAEAYAADQTRATDERCGLVQPITVEEGNALLAALNTANTFLKYDQ